jgi:hypothetical protein
VECIGCISFYGGDSFLFLNCNSGLEHNTSQFGGISLFGHFWIREYWSVLGCILLHGGNSFSFLNYDLGSEQNTS